jgi:tRNA 2-selenouridine synthase
MPLVSITAAEAITQFDRFDTLIDARSQGEYAEDHLPGALNWPVLDDDERAAVGTEYKQVSSFDARKRGAALVARHIAEHVEQRVHDKPRSWKPLVYCWRGGQRSGTLAWFLAQIGFHTHVLAGGYKAFRTEVIRELETLPDRFDWRVVCGRTGSGKTRLLQALRRAGAQVLDLEDLASHRGSVLGHLPGRPQPGQKAFETAVWSALRGFDPARPVFVESESAKVGNLRVPMQLLERMRRDGRCVRVAMPDAARLALLLEDYAFFVQDPELLCRSLEPLVTLRGKDKVRAWQDGARAGRVAEVFLQLMHEHYDPGYERSMQRNFAGYDRDPALDLPDGDEATLDAAARGLVDAAP